MKPQVAGMQTRLLHAMPAKQIPKRIPHKVTLPALSQHSYHCLRIGLATSSGSTHEGRRSLATKAPPSLTRAHASCKAHQAERSHDASLQLQVGCLAAHGVPVCHAKQRARHGHRAHRYRHRAKAAAYGRRARISAGDVCWCAGLNWGLLDATCTGSCLTCRSNAALRTGLGTQPLHAPSTAPGDWTRTAFRER